MSIEQAIKLIVQKWEVLRHHQKETFKRQYLSVPESDAVWIAQSDIAGAYEVDEEWVGINPQGGIVWAYASGCSCWGGDYTEETKPTLKELTLEHSHTPEEWEKAIITFAETGVFQAL